MANVDLTLRITNPNVYNQLIGLSTNGLNVRLNLTPNLSVAQLRQQITQQIGNIPVTITPTLANANQLAASIRQAIGNISINVSIGNLAALNAQIAQVFAGLGIQANNAPPPRGNNAQAQVRQLGRIYARQLGDQGDPDVDQRLNNVPATLNNLAQQPGINGILAEDTSRIINRRNYDIARRRARANAEFREKELLAVAIHGPDQAATDFEESKGLRAGAINRNVPRLSFDIGRAFNPAAFREIAISTAVGGGAGGIGGAIGAGFLGSSGVYGGATIGQAVVGAGAEAFNKLAEALKKASGIALEFEKSSLGVASALSSVSKIVDKNGNEAGTAESVRFQKGRAGNLLSSARRELAPYGVGQDVAATLLRGVTSGAGQSGLQLSDEQTVRAVKILGAYNKNINEDSLTNLAKVANASTDLFANQPTAGREELNTPFKSQLPAFRKAVDAGDAEAAVRALEKFSPALNVLTQSTDSAVMGFSKYDTTIQNLEISFVQAFNNAIVPELKALTDELNKPDVGRGLEALAKGIGKLTSILIGAAGEVTALANSPKVKKITDEATNSTGTATKLGKLIVKLGGSKEYLDNVTEIQKGIDIDYTNRKLLQAQDAKKQARGLNPIDYNTPRVPNVGGLKSVSSETPEQKEIRELNKKLRATDSETPVGKFQAEKIKNRLAQLGEDNKGNISKEVLQAQQLRADKLFGIQQTIRDTDATSIAGGARASIFGIGRQALTGEITQKVANVQEEKTLNKALTDITTSFYSMQKGVLDANTAFEDTANRGKELALTFADLQEQGKAFADTQKLSSLQGKDKLNALAQQVRAAGGNVDLDLEHRTGAGFAVDKKDILEQQFKVEAQAYLRQHGGVQDGEDLSGGQTSGIGDQRERLASKRGLKAAAAAADPKALALDASLAEANKYKAVLDFADRFTPEVADKLFSEKDDNGKIKKSAYTEALSYFNAQTKSIGSNGKDLGASIDSLKSAITDLLSITNATVKSIDTAINGLQ